MSITLKSGGNTSMSPTGRSDPRSSYKCYLERDIRHQSLKNPQGLQDNPPPETLYSKVSSTISNYTLKWNGPKPIPQETGKNSSREMQKLRTSQILDSTSSVDGMRNRGCHTQNSQGMKKRDRKKGEYDNLTYAQKVEMIVNDEIQWLKLKQSLREAGGLWSNFAVQQVLHEHVQQRVDEIEQLELAMRESNKNRTLGSGNLPMLSEELKKEEEQGLAGPLTQLTKNFIPQVLLLKGVNKSWLKRWHE